MKKFLPKLFILLFTLSVFISFNPVVAHAAVPDDSWVIDKEVTFVGKNAARSGLLLDWTLQDYKWASVSAGIQNPLIPFWVTMRNIVYALFVLFVITTAFILVTTRGRSLSAKRFLPRFIAVVLLVTFSFALLQFLYQITDGIQGFFLRSSVSVSCPPECISQKDLFYWSWNYQDFLGLRKVGAANNESAYISLFLTKLSALTYYVMIGILIVRKIILWFFIVVSPIFPLLLLYYPARNTGKIWVGEFFRWLFYAPLFAIFLSGLVSLWRQNIPLGFISGIGGAGVYPTAVNILLAGPTQTAAFNNSVNTVDTYALYVVAIIMLWVVIILPFILLQIFLDYFNNISFTNSPGWSQVVTMLNKRFPPIVPPGSPLPPGPATTGLARVLPFRGRFKVPTSTSIANSVPATLGQAMQIPREQSIANNAEILKLTNLAVPTMRDIARFESARLQKDNKQLVEISKLRENLEKIAYPQSISNTSDRQRYTQIRDSLIKESQMGSPMATSILKAAESLSSVTSNTSKESRTLKEILQNIARPEVVSALDREKYVELRERIEKESQKGNTTASSILNTINNISQSTNSVSTTQTSSISNMLSQLTSPSSITNASDREKLTSLKNQLTSESQTGNTVAKEVLSTLEKLSSTSVSKSDKDQQVTLLKELIQKESQNGNTLATSLMSLIQKETTVTDRTNIKEIVRQLTSPGSISDSLAREKVTALKNQLVSEEKAGNIIAGKILNALNNTSSSASDSEREKIILELRSTLLQEANKGNDLAVSVLSLVKVEDSDVDIQKVKERLEKAKANGDSLATTLLALLASQNIKAVADTEHVAQKSAIPTTNRIQQVSLDDYEAVRDMWVENYQNLDVPISSSGEESTRKQWIEEDMQQISDTISLLASSEQEKIDKGMEEVSNILPFLLIGGFSQTEITAYLKAKLEAGKEALKIVESSSSDEDTLLDVKRTVSEAQKTMDTSAHVSMSNPNINTSSVEPEVATQPIVIKPQITINMPESSSTQKIMNLANITIPKMLEIAKYETALRSGASTTQSASTILNTISNLANPNSITDIQKRSQVSALRDSLMKESQNGNTLAGSILSAAGVVDKDKAGVTTDDLAPIIKLIKELFDPTLIPNPTDREKYIELNKKLDENKGSGDELAIAIRQLIKFMGKEYIYKVQKLIREINAPDEISDIAHKTKFASIKEALVQEQRAGSVVASNILRDSGSLNLEGVKSLKDSLLQEKNIGNSVAGQVLAEFPQVPAIDVVSAKNIKSKLDQQLSIKSPLAIYIQTFLLRKEDIGGENILLPESNKLQAVSLDDYESVKKLWIDNYKNTENQEETLKNDERDILEAINLLSSPEKVKIEMGMDKVASILPFLLIGGFSQSETVSYLKAKLEAIKTVRNEKNAEDTRLPVLEHDTTPQNTLTQAQEINNEETKK